MMSLPTDPILSPGDALAFEEKFFNGDEDLQWEVMTKAGEAVADSALRDMRELRTIPHRPRLSCLQGKVTTGPMPSLLRGDSCAPFPLRERWFGHLSQKKTAGR